MSAIRTAQNGEILCKEAEDYNIGISIIFNSIKNKDKLEHNSLKLKKKWWKQTVQYIL